MKIAAIGLLVLSGVGASLAAPPSAAAECPGEAAAVPGAEVIDARTLRLADGRLLRMAGIEPFTLLLDAPGDAEERMTRRMAEIIRGAPMTMRLLSDKPDRHGRLPALVASGGATVAETLVREGLALAFDTEDALPCFDRLLAAEAEARDARRGYWNEAAVLEATPEALAPRIGRFAIFEGKVLSVGARRTATYLDFGTSWRTDVTIIIADRDRQAFGGEAAIEKLAGSTIRARGFLSESGGPLLRAHSPMQLETVGAEMSGFGIAP